MRRSWSRPPATSSASANGGSGPEGPGLVAYLADPCAIAGTGTLLLQKRKVDAYAAPARIGTYYVDSGWPGRAAGHGEGFLRLLGLAEAGAPTRVIVEIWSRFGYDDASALNGLERLLEAGASVHEASRRKPVTRTRLAAIRRSIATPERSL